MIEPISIDLASLNIPSLAPMLVAIVGALIILCIDLFSKNLYFLGSSEVKGFCHDCFSTNKKIIKNLEERFRPKQLHET